MGWNKLATTAYVDAQVDTADAISELSDVTIDTSATSELLFTTGANTWVNKTLAEAGIHPLTTVGISDGNLLAANDAVADNDWLRINATEVEGVNDSELIAALSLEIGVDVQAYDAQLADLAGLAVTDSSFIVGDGSNFVLEDASTSRTSLGLGDSATGDVGSEVQEWSSRLDKFMTGTTADGAMWIGTGTGEADWALESGDTLRTSMGLAIGTDVQAEDAVLTDIAALSAVADNEMIVGTSAGVYAHESGTTLRTSIGLGTGDAASFTDLTLSGGDLTFSTAGTITAADVATGTGLRVDLHGGDGKAGVADLTAGALVLAGGQGTGSGAGGDILFQVANAGIATHTTQNALATALTISDDKSATFAGTMAVTGAATFSSSVTVAGDLDVQGTTTTINSANTSFTDTSIQLNVADGEEAFGDSASAIVFGDSTGATSTGRIINAGTAGGGFKFMDGNATNTPTGNNNTSDGANYVNAYMRMPVLADVDDTPTAIAGALWFDGTDIHVGT